ncbi:hypothetical protein [Rhabdaerophilum sp. SD176]|uniref:hypothetical protein n=1 Tax=Rhabdaerophilum sp. SD176 TaxID=2983548 RepID=UPI0024DFE2A0|nr:hypothetical protein [Rhabdaerophilum sp. SD176]
MAHQTRRSPDFHDAIQIWQMLHLGMFQHDIAAKFGFNQGRISEVKTGKLHPTAREEAMRRLSR